MDPNSIKGVDEGAVEASGFWAIAPAVDRFETEPELALGTGPLCARCWATEPGAVMAWVFGVVE
jgi:hypothetical protein